MRNAILMKRARYTCKYIHMDMYTYIYLPRTPRSNIDQFRCERGQPWPPTGAGVANTAGIPTKTVVAMFAGVFSRPTYFFAL